MNKLKNKKVAIIHDSFTQFGGAEKGFVLSDQKNVPQS